MENQNILFKAGRPTQKSEQQNKSYCSVIAQQLSEGKITNFKKENELNLYQDYATAKTRVRSPLRKVKDMNQTKETNIRIFEKIRWKIIQSKL